jgi:type IX secretion system PorP/SprF family membrane protein
MVNPAYVGSVENTYRRLSLSADWQWVGMDGAPKMQVLQFLTGLPNSGGIGGWFYHEGYGVTDIIQFGGIYSHSFKLTDDLNLSLGLSLSALTVSEDLVTGIDDPNDPMFSKSELRVWGFNSGFGAMLYTDSYYVGLSMPQLLTNNWEEGASEPKIKNAFKFDQLRFYLTGGYVFKVSDDVSIMPNALLQFSGNTSFGYEFMVRGDYKKRVAVGVGYGYDKAIKAEAGVFISKEVSLAYRYQQSFGDTYKHLSGSHSITLSVTWDRDKHDVRMF